MPEFSEGGGLSRAEWQRLASRLERSRRHVRLRIVAASPAADPSEVVKPKIVKLPPVVVEQKPVASTEDAMDVDAKAAGPDVTEAAIDAVAAVITVPITSAVMAGVTPLGGADINAVAGERVDNICEALQDIVDPARIPSALVSRAVTHLLAPLATASFGPIGPVIAIFAGNFAGEFTHQILDASLDCADIQQAESAIELAGVFTDTSIGRLAESQPFADYVSDLVGRQVAAIIDKRVDPVACHESKPVTRKTGTITAVIAVYEVDASPSRSGSAASSELRTLRVRPASFAILKCIPADTVATQWQEGRYEFMLLADGTTLKRRIDGALSGRWSQVLLQLTGKLSAVNGHAAADPGLKR